jgi:iron transport multicopper oxidase
MQLVEAPLEMQSRLASGQYTIPSALPSQCSTLGMPVSGNAAGHVDDPTNLSGLKLGPFPQNNGWHAKGIGAMFACVLAAVLGMVSVGWYSCGGLSEEEAEREVRRRVAMKEEKGRFGGLFPKKT